MRCVDACCSNAVEAIGSEMSVEEVLEEVEKDRVFYEESGGGLTLSGGEPLAQFDFTRDILSRAKQSGIHTCVETCGFAGQDRLISLVPHVDLFLWDIKDTDPARHRENTGADIAPVLENLAAVDKAGARTRLRCILIAGVNLLAYHPLGSSKRQRLGLDCASEPDLEPTPEEMDAAKSYLREKRCVRVV